MPQSNYSLTFDVLGKTKLICIISLHNPSLREPVIFSPAFCKIASTVDTMPINCLSLGFIWSISYTSTFFLLHSQLPFKSVQFNSDKRSSTCDIKIFSLARCKQSCWLFSAFSIFINKIPIQVTSIVFIYFVALEE